MIYAGIDLGGTTAKLGFFTEDAKLMKKWEVKTVTTDGGIHVIPNLAASVKEELKKSGMTLEDLKGVGLAVPGPIHKDGYLEQCVNIGMKDMNPVKEMSALLGGIPVKGGNDANVAALGEVWQGGGKGYTDVVCVTLGTGVGGGVIVNGKIVEGSKGMGGEVGHLRVEWDDALAAHCNCGNVGCIETIASATGIARVARKMLAETETPSVLREKDPERINAKNVFDAAKDRDLLAEEIADYCMKYLAKCLSLITMVTDPEIFVIGGGVSRAGQYLLDLVKKYYDPMVTLSKKKALIALATLGNDAGIFGSAKMAMDMVKGR